MEVTGSLPSQAEKQPLWDALMSADNWKAAIPDAEKYELIGENLYEMVVKIDIGPVKGNQTLQIQYSNLQPPNSCDFELQNAMVKSAKGHFDLKHPDELPTEEGAAPLPFDTRTVLVYKLEADAGNPIFNAMLDGFKDKIKSGFEELLVKLEAQAR